jgi:long-chain acyl-CoA synthetase
MSRIRVAYTAGAAIGPELFRFYRSMGINLKQFYGQTETCAYVCLQPDGQIKFDSVGQPAPGVEIKIADNGEVLVKGPMLLKEYYKRPDATAESINADGYFMTGDAGFLDEDGHLKIIDRAKDVGKLSNGAMFAPNYIENKLKFFQHIKEVVCFGHEPRHGLRLRQYRRWRGRQLGRAARHFLFRLRRSGRQAGSAGTDPRVRRADQCRSGQRQHGGRFADPSLPGLHKELDPDDDELTRTRKVRRNFVAEKYKVLIDALYAGKSSQFIETEVKFEDGRRGKVSADLKIVRSQDLSRS